MIKTKTKIEKQMQKKTSTELVKTIIAAKKNKAWIRVAEILSGPRKNRANLNLEEIDKKVEEDETVVIPGKVLSQGSVNKKIKIIALNFSEKAKEKLLKSKCEVLSIIEEIKKNPGADKVKILYPHSSAQVKLKLPIRSSTSQTKAWSNERKKN